MLIYTGAGSGVASDWGDVLLHKYPVLLSDNVNAVRRSATAVAFLCCRKQTPPARRPTLTARSIHPLIALP